MKIKTKLTWLLLGVGVPTIVVASGLGYIANERSVREGVSTHLSSLREAKSRHIEFFITSAQKSIEDLSRDRDIISTAAGTPSPNTRAFLERTRNSLQVDQVAILDATGKKRIEAARPNLPALLDSPPIAIEARPQMIDFVAREGERPYAYYLHPIYQNEQVIGFLTARFSGSQFSRICSGEGNWSMEGLGETGEVFIVGQDGMMRSDARGFSGGLERLYAGMMKSGVDLRTQALVKERRSTIGLLKIPKSEYEGDGKSKVGVIVTTGYLNVPVYAAYSPLRIKDMNWSVVCHMEVSEALLPLDALRRNTAISAICLIVIMVGVAWLAANSFVRPIKALADAAHRFGDGERGFRMEMTSRDEVGELGRAFDGMVERTEQMDEIADGIRRNIVHDLKTPVTVVQGMAETLKYPDVAADPHSRNEMIDAILEQSNHLLDDLKDILAPVNREYQPEAEEFDLSLLVEKVVKSEMHTGRAGSHEFEVYGTDQQIVVFADRRKVRRVIENLVSNAVKYSPGADKCVRIYVEAGDDEMVRISVQDEGLGMTRDQLFGVLRDGGRVMDEERSSIEGTGLGLGSVQMILKAHGGELLAQSEPGEGSRFTAVIPVKYQPVETDEIS